MSKSTLVTLLIISLFVAYIFTLTMSSLHLAQWYQTYNEGLPNWVGMGLAISLEATAFLLSVTSNALKGLISPWAFWGANAALLLVWFGNFYSMQKVAPAESLLVTFAATGFVGFTLVLGKVIGDLITLQQTLKKDSSPSSAQNPTYHINQIASDQSENSKPQNPEFATTLALSGNDPIAMLITEIDLLGVNATTPNLCKRIITQDSSLSESDITDTLSALEEKGFIQWNQNHWRKAS